MATRFFRDLPTISPEYNGCDRNDFLFAWTSQAEILNGRFAAMIGFLAYLV